MEILNKLFRGKGYIDGITIINLEGEILFTAKLNDKLSNLDYPGGPEEMVGKKFLDVYENLTEQNSTTYRAMQWGMPIYIENQLIKTNGREALCITALSIPIKSGNRIVGAIDLSTQERVETEEELPQEKIGLQIAPMAAIKQGSLERKTDATFVAEDIIAIDEKMKKAKDYIKVVAACDLPVMIYGETGTGKEVFAQAIHNESQRKNNIFVAQNCAAIPETLLESILFGTAKGAFTGALENKGLLELADGGTLFLDEINSMPVHLQSKLLRVLQDGSFRSLGSLTAKQVDVRVITAINTEPLKAIELGQLRRDVYYRLSMMLIKIPPLRERKADIRFFVEHYINKHNQTFHQQIRYVSNELVEKLEVYPWPGNVRELEHMVVYGMSVAECHSDTLKFEHIEEKYNEMMAAVGEGNTELEGPCLSLRSAVAEYEQKLIAKILKMTAGNLSEAAKILDIPRPTLQRKVHRHQLVTKEGEKS